MDPDAGCGCPVASFASLCPWRGAKTSQSNTRASEKIGVLRGTRAAKPCMSGQCPPVNRGRASSLHLGQLLSNVRKLIATCTTTIVHL